MDKLEESITVLGRATEQLGITAVGHMRDIMTTMQNPQERTVSLSLLEKNSEHNVFTPLDEVLDSVNVSSLSHSRRP